MYNFFLYSIFSLLIFTASCTQQKNHTKQEQIVNSFKQNKQIFYELSDKFKNDKYSKIAIDVDSNIDIKTFQYYKSNLTKIGAYSIHKRGIQSIDIEFTLFATGFVGGGESISIVHSYEKKGPLVTTFNDIKENNRNILVYIQLEPNWYIVYEYDR